MSKEFNLNCSLFKSTDIIIIYMNLCTFDIDHEKQSSEKLFVNLELISEIKPNY